MRFAFTRRRLLAGSALLLPSLALAPMPAAAQQAERDVDQQLAELEKRTGGRLGVSVFDTETNITLGYRETERFAICSTYKALAAALILQKVDKGEESLERRIVFDKEALVTYSPITEKQTGGEGMTLAEVCEAAVTLSDNTAGNLLLESLDGPQGFTKRLRTIGDASTRLDRTETALNEAKKDDPRDTTTPDAMLDTLGNLAIGTVLSEASRERLTGWLVSNRTGDARLRAGIPKEWKVGDKTGTGRNGAAADIAVVWPPGRGPILVTTYVAEATVPIDQVNPVFAEVGRIVAGMVV
ncbi:class A beta-lactamase [Rhizobium sp. BK251]|uniref:class A beta-lactamase n=1 Tax=Rhizobium sp. BK251 TaxID=2512125 RepID=UPI00104BEB45|nr:class A beta-lactamase [Rhizobium sp. BK251]TCL76082.1 beta-lactamase class A [Rhizobium sp. BK251]